MKLVLIGLLISSNSSRSVAAFHVDGKLELRRIGDRIGDLQLEFVSQRHVLYLRGRNGEVFAMRPGDSDLGPSILFREIYWQEDEIVLTEKFRSYLIGQNLAQTMMEVSSTPVIIKGECIGFMIDNFDPNSVFEAAGFQEGDVILEVNSYLFKDAMTAVKGLISVKNVDEFEVRFLRDMVEKKIKVRVQ